MRREETGNSWLSNLEKNKSLCKSVTPKVNENINDEMNQSFCIPRVMTYNQ
jgi:hypothetical protein